MQNPTDEFNEALLELGKITFNLIYERASKLVADKKPASETWLASLPTEILQACQACHGGALGVATERLKELRSEYPDDVADDMFEQESMQAAHVFILAGLTPPIDPVATLFECQIFVAAWKAYREESSKTQHLPATKLLEKINRIREVYRVPQSSGVTPD